MTRTDIINAEIRRGGYESYLEIGVRNPADNFDKIEIARKDGIDPTSKREDLYRGTSDDFFGEFQHWTYDIIFVDGDHRHEQVKKDVANSLDALSEGGIIVMHDCLPTSAKEAADEKPADGTPWCGGAWKVYAELNASPDAVCVVYDCDHGVAIVQGSKNSMRYVADAPPWELSRADRRSLYGAMNYV